MEGDRDRERRRDRTAAETSTWCTLFGEGSVKVPPLLFPYDIVGCRWASLKLVGYRVNDRFGVVAGRALELVAAGRDLQCRRSQSKYVCLHISVLQRKVSHGTTNNLVPSGSQAVWQIVRKGYKSSQQ